MGKYTAAGNTSGGTIKLIHHLWLYSNTTKAMKEDVYTTFLIPIELTEEAVHITDGDVFNKYRWMSKAGS